MIYTVKPIKKRILIFRNDNKFTIEVDLHPNQKWLVYEFGDTVYISKGHITINIANEELTKYFREVEE